MRDEVTSQIADLVHVEDKNATSFNHMGTLKAGQKDKDAKMSERQKQLQQSYKPVKLNNNRASSTVRATLAANLRQNLKQNSARNSTQNAFKLRTHSVQAEPQG